MLTSCRGDILRRRLRFEFPFRDRLFFARSHAQSLDVLPKVLGAGETQPHTPLSPPRLAWYRQPQFLRSIVNIMLLASFANSTVIILSYKSQKKEMLGQAKERRQTLKETIEK